jgi:Arc/MetJ family transcription regulator
MARAVVAGPRSGRRPVRNSQPLLRASLVGRSASGLGDILYRQPADVGEVALHPRPVIDSLPSWGLVGYLDAMSKTSVDVDRDIARQAAKVLGTTTLRDTINASMREVVHAKRRLELIAMLSEEGRFDFQAAEKAWGADE